MLSTYHRKKFIEKKVIFAIKTIICTVIKTLTNIEVFV